MSELILPRSWQDWHITDEIGEGSYGRVYRAEKENGGVKVISAIKVIHIPSEKSEYLSLRREFSSDEDLRRNLKKTVDEYTNEIRAMYRLQGHSHIVSIQDHLVEERRDGIGWIIYIRMEYLQSFDDYALAHSFTKEEIIRLGISLCEALSTCAESGILHRDIKPENLFVTNSGQFKLGDFGIAKAMDKTIPSFSSKGTFSYMAPEVFQGKPYDTRADLYSTGIVLYKLLNRNRDPFIDPDKQIITRQDREQAMSRRMTGEPLPSPVDADRSLEKVILKACAYDPKDRYDSPVRMKQALENLLQPGKETTEKQKRRRPVLLFAILLLCVAGAVVLLICTGKPPAELDNSAPSETAANQDASFTDENYGKAAEWYLRSAEQGNANAQYRLGLLYCDGRGVEQNYEEAVKWFTEAAKQNHPEALDRLGMLAENGYGMERDEQQAAEWYRQSAEQGNTDAQYRLGLLYCDGRGVEQNYEDAVKWFEKAAEQGNAGAQYRLGLLCSDGRGVEQDYGEALKWFEKAAEQNQPDAEYELGSFYEKGHAVERDIRQALSWYIRSAEHGSAQAQGRLGDFYYTNSNVQEEGVEKDNVQAAKWYRLAAEQGNVDAQGRLAICYYYGQGVGQDLIEALHWFSKAGQKDPGYQSLVEYLYSMGWDSKSLSPEENAVLQYDMGFMYFEGNGMAQDYTKAFQWFMQAAELNHQEAQDYVGQCYAYGYGTEQDDRQAVEWFERSAGQGNANAQYHLALMYHSGRGVDQSYPAAFGWFKKAAEQDHQEAQNYVGLYYENGFAGE